MSEEIYSERLLLRTSDPALAAPILSYYSRNRVFFSTAEPAFPEEYYTLSYQTNMQLQEVRRMENGQSAYYYFSLLHEPERIIGSMSFANIRKEPYLSTVFGYDVDEEEQGKGYTTEACSAAMKHLFTRSRIHRVEARVLPENKASIRVLEKLGFQYEGIERSSILIRGSFHDHLRYSYINEDFQL